MRLFVGLKLDPDQRQALSHIQQFYQTRISNRALQWHSPENLHITLKFLGEVTPEQCQQLLKHLPSQLVRQTMTFSPKKLDWFPSLTKPIVLAAHYQHPAITQQLLDAIQAALVASQTPFKREQRGFRAHVTLARNNKPTPVKTLTLPECTSLPTLSFTSYHLFESRHVAGELSYQSLAELAI